MLENLIPVLERLKENKGIRAIFLFGSYAREDNHANSDIDLCIIGELSQNERMKILRDTDEKFDISFFDELPIYIKFAIFREGKALFCNDEDYLFLLKNKTLHDYFDFKIRILNKHIVERIKNA